jgi:hypothetical protein
MSLTPEQFDKLVTKDYLDERLGNFISKEYFDNRMDALFNLVDGLATAVKKNDIELVANVGAHDRIQAEVNAVDLRVKKLEGVA